jgi:hypothetical protein
MDAEAAVGALETAIADAGAALVQLQKFRGALALHATLLGETMRLGDRARAAHRGETLDARAAAALAAEARTLAARAAAALADVRAAPAFRAAVAAHAAGDHAALRRLLPAVFAGLAPVDVRPDLFLAVPWLRRNRPRAPDDVADVVEALRKDGIAAESDPAAPGVDAELPAVALLREPPGADPVLLRFAGDGLPPAVFVVVDADEHLVHVPRLRAPFAVVLPPELDPDELGEISVDHAAYRAELAAALAARGVAAFER